MESAFQAVHNALPKLENRVIEFLAEWLVALLAPARHVLETRSPHLSFMLLKDYWFRELYLSLKVTASLSESLMDRFDVSHLTSRIKIYVAWNVQYVVIFVPAWDSPYIPQLTPRKRQKHGLRKLDRVKSVRPTWFQDTTATRGPPPSAGQGTPEPMHGLRLMIKEEAMIISDQPSFPAVAELAKRGLLSPETWQCNRPRISLKTSIDVPMLGDIIEQNGDGLLEESHMPAGWPLHIDGAVRQRCIHRDTTLLELDDLLSEYDTGEAPTPSPKIISVSGAKNEPKRSLFSLLVFVMTTFPFLIC